tara:strand:- start:495 stop:806 length:312 start_codon:yes stop_codon:yes gene_type:complete
MEDYLNQLVEEFPSRASGEDLYEYIRKQSAGLVDRSRVDFSNVMMNWLSLRSEPKTMLAVDLIGFYQLSELKGELESLQAEVTEGRVFKPFYDKEIRKTLSLI